MEIRYKVNPKILILSLFGIIMMFTSYLMFVYDPIKIIMKEILTLRQGNLFYSVWSNPPYEVYINARIFTVKNKDAFLENGTKLEFEEIGPYVYQEMLSNGNATFNDNGTLSYVPRRTFKFIREKSVGDPLVDRVITPNIPLVGISSYIKDFGWAANLGIEFIVNRLNTQPFLNVTVEEYLWGYEDELITAANTLIPSWIDFERFGILERLLAVDNADNLVTITTDTSKPKPQNPLLTEEEVNRIFYVQEINGSPGLSKWGYQDVEGNQTAESNSRCNLVAGTYDGTIFPSYLNPHENFKLFRPAFCRPVPFLWENETYSKEGFEAMKYVVKPDFLASPDLNPDNACYCVDGKCLPSGLSSISPCYYGIPITLSQPHFYNAEPFLLDQFTGMEPDAAKHGSSFLLHKQMGVPLEAILRIQINLDVGQTRVSRAKYFNDMYLPLFWLEMQVEEPPTIIWLMGMFGYRVLPVVLAILKYLLALGGAAMVSGSALLMLFSSKDVMEMPSNPFHTPLNNLPFTRFSLRRSSEYTPLPVIPCDDYFEPEITISK